MSCACASVRIADPLKRLYCIACTATKVSTAEAIVAEKKSIRKTIAALNKTLDYFDVALQSKSITEQVFESKWFASCKRISIYVSTQGEVMTDSLIRGCLARKKDIFIPHFERGSNQMDMIKLETLQEFCDLDATLWGIRQHAKPPKALSWKEFGPLDVVLLPGVAFTRDGHRLGHGKGFYDRFLVEHREMHKKMPYTVGLALEHQMRENLPVTKTDVKLDLVLSSR